MRDYNFYEFNRQNGLGVIIIFAQSVRRAINAFLAIFAWSYLSNGFNAYSGTIAIVILTLMAVTSVLSYRNFRFKLTESQLILNSGILTKEVTNIPLERIQSVQLHQNFIQRILNITGLKIDTAGSSAQELEISALNKKVARELLKLLQSKLKLEKEKVLVEEELSQESDEENSSEKSLFTKLVKLDFKGLVVLAITENHVRNGLIALAFIMGYASQYMEYVEEYVLDRISGINAEFLQSSLVKFVSFVVIFLLLSILLSFVQVFLRFWDFKAEVNDRSFVIKSGLLKRNEYTIPLKKIQFLEWRTNLLRKIPGFESIKIHQGRSVESVRRNQAEIPACYAEQSDIVMDILFPEHNQEREFSLTQPHSYQRIFRSVVFSLLGIPVFLLAAISTGNYVLCSLGYLIYFIFTLINARKYVDSVNLWINDELLIYERGWIFPKRTVIKHYKVQTTEITQSIFQKRRGVCHLSFSTAAGGRSLRFFHLKEMEELRDYLLYKIEGHKGSWM